MSDATPPVVVAHGLSKSYASGSDTLTVLAGADFRIAQGEHIALVGPSGSGKSTLLHLISAIDTPSAGSIEWPALGDAATLRPARIGMAFQTAALLPALTVLENVALPLLLTGVAEDAAMASARELLGQLGLESVCGSLPEELSGGQSQRTGLARALVTRPPLVLADEPTGQQDRAGASVVVDILLAYAEQTGAALLIATHDEQIAARLPVRWTIERGALNEKGSPAC